MHNIKQLKCKLKGPKIVDIKMVGSKKTDKLLLNQTQQLPSFSHEPGYVDWPRENPSQMEDMIQIHDDNDPTYNES